MINNIKIIQKNVPKTIRGASSAPSSSAFFILETGGIIARIKKEKNKATINNESQFMPHSTGPKGNIHN